ncbi:uncharacterized protein BCR38DRAFT_525927 [Pseudomassariella vexata]|uniref:Uncharacterized protein n=1 Tax=Pseudomassariella vexata TaxID=1141098 RepID=A0A1Y2DR22_9PEZI|nr:uncharacterized protein BCR38DRAFT_525927 [Pseudomassariella vexata]ORY61556.1 hypothetical protein BCR38DRAFT_525927 [Pseudomassariella vexata]
MGVALSVVCWAEEPWRPCRISLIRAPLAFRRWFISGCRQYHNRHLLHWSPLISFQSQSISLQSVGTSRFLRHWSISHGLRYRQVLGAAEARPDHRFNLRWRPYHHLGPSRAQRRSCCHLSPPTQVPLRKPPQGHLRRTDQPLLLWHLRLRLSVVQAITP